MATPTGICGSRIQKEWLESTLQISLQTSAHFGPDFTSTQLAVGVGFFSIIARVSCDWQGDGADKLPPSFVLKMPSLVALEKLFGGPDSFEEYRDGSFSLLKKAHACEVSFYSLVQEHKLELQIPKVYYSYNTGADGQLGMLIMEDLSLTGAVKNVADGIPLKGLETIVENLATLHAFSFTNRKWLEDDNLKVYLFAGQTMLVQGWLDSSIAAFKKLAPDDFPDSFLDPLVKTIIPQFDKKYAFHVHEELGIPPILTHGDLHNNNTMWKKTADGSGTTDELAAIVDWQIMHPGCVAEDLARIFCSSAEADIRREFTNHLLMHYYKTLTTRLNKEPPFTFDQLKLAYRHLFRFATIVFLPGFAHFAQDLSAQGKIAEKDAILRRCKLLIEDLYAIESGKPS